MRNKRGRVKLVRILKAGRMAKRKPERPPKVNPRVTPQEAVRALKRFPGGAEVIKLLERAGKRL